MSLSSTALSTRPTASAFFDTFYGQSGAVNATIAFTDTLGATASFSLVGNQTVCDYSTNTFTHDLQSYNTSAAYGAVTTKTGCGHVRPPDFVAGQRLDQYDAHGLVQLDPDR